MIVFDLQCTRGHVFESWFGSSEDYEDQRARGLVACPLCGDPAVEKAVMAPRVAAKSNQRPAPPAASGGDAAPARMKALLAAVAAAQREMLAGSEDVGRRFAEEARAIHAGESDARAIHGRASIDEARALLDEGVTVMPLLVPPPDEPVH